MPKPGRNTQPAPDPFRVSIGRFADLVGIHHATAGQWVKDGMPHQRDGRTTWIDLATALPWVRQKYERDAEAAGGDYDAERTRKTRADATLKEMEIAEAEGRLVPASDVEETWAQMIVAFREAAIGAAAVAVQDGLIEPAQEPALETLIISALDGAKAEVLEDKADGE